MRDVWFCRYGPPESILTDNGTAFKGSPMRKLLQEWQVIHHKITPYHPQANPVERTHAEVKRLIRATQDEGLDWKDRLQLIAFCLRNRVITSLVFPPAN